MHRTHGGSDGDMEAGLSARVAAARVERAQLARGTVALLVELLGRGVVLVSDDVPQGEVAAVVRHLLQSHKTRCHGPVCGVGKHWSDTFPPPSPPMPLSDAV